MRSEAMVVDDAPPFLRACWYVAAWDHELAAGVPLAAQVLNEPIVLYRGASGTLRALANRCAHRHAPLALGRVEGEDLRCLYHGLLYGPDGRCREAPGVSTVPPGCRVRAYPAVARDGWIWVWMGAPEDADHTLVPAGFGIDARPADFRTGTLDYAADYRLINDNLCDLSHLDFLHLNTLGAASGGGWVEARPRIRVLERGIRVERWRPGREASTAAGQPADIWNGYSFLAPGVFLMDTRVFPRGEADRCGGGTSTVEPLLRWLDQQAVTPVTPHRCRYFFASGAATRDVAAEVVDRRFAVLQAAFAEDRVMIEGQQELARAGGPREPPVFLPQDRAPMLMRRVIDRLFALERTAPPDAAP